MRTELTTSGATSWAGPVAASAGRARGSVRQATSVIAAPSTANVAQIAGQPKASKGVSAGAARPRPAPAPATTIPAPNTATPGATAIRASPVVAAAPASSTVPRGDRAEVFGDSSSPRP